MTGPAPIRTVSVMAASITGGSYEIVVDAGPHGEWSAWFDEFAMTSDDGTTRLEGTIPDQAALHGVLARLRDLDIPILSVSRLPGSDARRQSPPSRRRPT